MGYALKIPSVDFSGVAVDQIEYTEPVPCTGLTLDKSTLSFESVDETKTLTAMVTPNDTTDTLTWASSDENVATVANGVVTIHGIGSATITATCGTQTASAMINQTTIKAPYALKSVSDVAPDGYALAGGDEIIALQSVSGQKTVGQPYHNDDDLRVVNGQTNDVECVKIPYGATKCKIKTNDDVAASISYWFLLDCTDLLSYNSNKFPKKLAKNTFFNTSTGANVSFGQAILFRPLDAQSTTLSYVYFE